VGRGPYRQYPKGGGVTLPRRDLDEYRQLQIRETAWRAAADRARKAADTDRAGDALRTAAALRRRQQELIEAAWTV
jgi:hypothetical protein